MSYKTFSLEPVGHIGEPYKWIAPPPYNTIPVAPFQHVAFRTRHRQTQRRTPLTWWYDSWRIMTCYDMWHGPRTAPYGLLGAEWWCDSLMKSLWSHTLLPLWMAGCKNNTGLFNHFPMLNPLFESNDAHTDAHVHLKDGTDTWYAAKKKI